MKLNFLHSLFILITFLYLSKTTAAQNNEQQNADQSSAQPAEEAQPSTPPNILNLYFNTKLDIADGLHDPQEILNEEQSKIILDLITNHSEKSKIPIMLFLFKQNQESPLTESTIHTRLNKIFVDKDQLLVFYYYGNALKSNGHLLLKDEDELLTNNWEVNEMFLKSARDASVPVDHFDQLESYVKELSKRSFWIESKFTKNLLIEETPIEQPSVKKEADTIPKYIQTILNEYFLSILTGFIVITAGAWYYLWNRKWRQYVLPLKEMPRRLGAEHGATISTPLEFSDVKVSLSDQRSKARSKDLEDI